MSNYYAVKCKCGHVGKNNCIIITFPVVAESGKDAAKIARMIPRCKHHHKDCIREVTKIDYEEYLRIKEVNNNDLYLQCKCIQEQNQLDLSDRIEEDMNSSENEHFKEEIIHKIYKGKTKIRNPKKFFRFNNSLPLICEY